MWIKELSCVEYNRGGYDMKGTYIPTKIIIVIAGIISIILIGTIISPLLSQTIGIIGSIITWVVILVFILMVVFKAL